VLIALVREARSVCTIREASGALARLRHPEAFDVLVELLPRDVQFAHPMLAARWLAVLGDERAVPHLVRAMQRRGDDSDPIVDAGIHFARGQAALALGRFDTDVAARALERALTDEAIAEYAHAALYRLTNDDGHIAALESLDPEALVFLASYLDEIGRPRARALAERIRAAEDRADGAGDDGDDGGE
jgi:hypothetical protein